MSKYIQQNEQMYEDMEIKQNQLKYEMSELRKVFDEHKQAIEDINENSSHILEENLSRFSPRRLPTISHFSHYNQPPSYSPPSYSPPQPPPYKAVYEVDFTVNIFVFTSLNNMFVASANFFVAVARVPGAGDAAGAHPVRGRQRRQHRHHQLNNSLRLRKYKLDLHRRRHRDQRRLQHNHHLPPTGLCLHQRNLCSASRLLLQPTQPLPVRRIRHRPLFQCSHQRARGVSPSVSLFSPIRKRGLFRGWGERLCTHGLRQRTTHSQFSLVNQAILISCS